MNVDKIAKALRAAVEMLSEENGSLVARSRTLIPELLDLLAAKDAQISQLAAGRDAAVDDILIAVDEGKCAVCKHATREDGPRTQICEKWPNRECWEWRGAKEDKP